MKYIRKSIQELKEYSVPQDKYKVKLNQNESPYDVPEDLKEEIIKRMMNTDWNRYPSRTAIPLVEAISEYTNFPKEGIVAANASNEIIQGIFQAICDSGDKLVAISPGFAIYPYLSQIMDLNLAEVPLLEDFSFDVAAIIKEGKDAKLVVLALPNNPTGTTISNEQIEEIAQNINGILVVDEAYYEFSKKTAISLLDKYDNIIIIRTLSKAFGLAGLRLGYLLTNAEIASAVQKAKLPFSVGIFGQIAGEILLKKNEYIKNIVKKILDEKEKVFAELKGIPTTEPVPSFTNFILFKTQSISGKELFEEMYRRGVLLRFFNTPRLKDTLRVTIGKPEGNEIFLKTLKEVLQDEKS
ncbi:histidinol-phosphate transaminase [candidate division WOR-3 bacterium]|nr:histidinol-phosphate transaminase [candidate division WOR-3 bacterium]